MKAKIYVSVPVQVKWDAYVYPHIRRLQELGFEVSYWSRGMPYSDEQLKRADAVLVILQDNKFKISQGELTKGVRSELELAYKMRKDVFLGYKNQAGELNIYTTYEDLSSYGGKAGYLNDESLIDIKEAFAPYPAKEDYYEKDYPLDEKDGMPFNTSDMGKKCKPVNVDALIMGEPENRFDRRILLLM